MHQHNTPVSATTRARIARAVEKAAERLPRAVEATVRVERDGVMRRVEVVVLVPPRRRLVATGEARTLHAAVALATTRLGGRAARSRDKRSRKNRARSARKNGR